MMDEKDINRMLMHYQQLLKSSNREHINPVIEELKIDDLKPMVQLVAKSRAAYLKYAYDLGKKYFGTETYPSADELKMLKTLRLRFSELADAAQAFETSIHRGYLDVHSSKP